MAKKYTYTRTVSTVEGQEAFTASEFDSFEEAKKAVDRGIYDRMLELDKAGKLPRQSTASVPGPAKVSDNKGDENTTRANTPTGNAPANVPSTTGGQQILDK